MIDDVTVGEALSSSDYNIITFNLLYDSHTTWKEYYFDYRLSYRDGQMSAGC